MNVRSAYKSEGPQLSDLAIRSKAVWGYSDEFLVECREELTISSVYIQSSEVFVLEEAGSLLGFYAFFGPVPDAILDFLYVDPACIERGFGTVLWRHAVARAKRLGFSTFSIDVDPYAEAFYLKMGAGRVGEVPSGSISGRMLPQLRYRL